MLPLPGVVLHPGGEGLGEGAGVSLKNSSYQWQVA